MKRISILALDDCTSIAPIGAMEIFRKADALYQMLHQTDRRLFDARLISLTGKVQFDNGLVWNTHDKIENLKATDLLMIPAIEFDIEDKLKANQALIPHIRRLFDNGSELASMCTGSFLLAETGLLAGKRATTHWAKAEEFAERFPEVILEDEKLIVDNGTIYCGGGATSFLNLVLYLIEKYAGKDIAVEASKMLLIDYSKPQQSHYQLFLPQLRHGDLEISKIQDYVHNCNEWPINLGLLAEKFNMSTKTLARRFAKATGQTPNSYLRQVQIEKAKHLFENSQLNIGEVAVKAGYRDQPSFRKAFKKATGFAPNTYRKMYSRTR